MNPSSTRGISGSQLEESVVRAVADFMPAVEAKDPNGRASGDLSEHSRPVNGPGLCARHTLWRYQSRDSIKGLSNPTVSPVNFGPPNRGTALSIRDAAGCKREKFCSEMRFDALVFT